jgi:hypothetical protein
MCIGVWLLAPHDRHKMWCWWATLLLLRRRMERLDVSLLQVRWLMWRRKEATSDERVHMSCCVVLCSVCCDSIYNVVEFTARFDSIQFTTTTTTTTTTTMTTITTTMLSSKLGSRCYITGMTRQYQHHATTWLQWLAIECNHASSTRALLDTLAPTDTRPVR